MRGAEKEQSDDCSPLGNFWKFQDDAPLWYVYVSHASTMMNSTVDVRPVVSDRCLVVFDTVCTYVGLGLRSTTPRRLRSTKPKEDITPHQSLSALPVDSDSTTGSYL